MWGRRGGLWENEAHDAQGLWETVGHPARVWEPSAWKTHGRRRTCLSLCPCPLRLSLCLSISVSLAFLYWKRHHRCTPGSIRKRALASQCLWRPGPHLPTALPNGHDVIKPVSSWLVDCWVGVTKETSVCHNRDEGSDPSWGVAAADSCDARRHVMSYQMTCQMWCM